MNGGARKAFDPMGWNQKEGDQRHFYLDFLFTTRYYVNDA